MGERSPADDGGYRPACHDRDRASLRHPQPQGDSKWHTEMRQECSKPHRLRNPRRAGAWWKSLLSLLVALAVMPMLLYGLGWILAQVLPEDAPVPTFHVGDDIVLEDQQTSVVECRASNQEKWVYLTADDRAFVESVEWREGSDPYGATGGYVRTFRDAQTLEVVWVEVVD